MIILIFTSAVVSLLAGLFFIKWARDHPKHYSSDKPQRFHLDAVPRIGGLGITLGAFAGWLAMPESHIWPWLALSLPAVWGGVLEDLTQRLLVKYRFLLTLMSAVLACYFLKLSVPNFGVDAFNAVLLQWPWLGIGVAVLAICGLPHAFNLIDGYNGLAGTVACLVCLSIAYVALQVGDRELAGIVLCLAGATIGFLCWNYPKGWLFAGDGGAYLWGVVIAVAAVLLVQRHKQVSPWFPMLLLIYPVWETIFSIYRKLAKGLSPGVADALHFHQLIYRRLVRTVFHDDASRQMLMRNNRTSPWLWGFTLLTVVPAVLFWRNTWVLMGFCVLFVVSYVAAYLMLIRFKVPQWLRH